MEILLQSAASAEALDLESLGRIVIGRSGSYIADCASRGSFGAVFWVVTVFSVLALLVVPYFLGSINFGIIISKLFHGEDLREYGSGNAGMTNMLRTYGKRDAAITLIGDALKAVVAVILGRILFGISGGYVAGLTCILGHAFPCYYKFKGGKGVVVTAATIAVIDWRIFLVLLGIFIRRRIFKVHIARIRLRNACFPASCAGVGSRTQHKCPAFVLDFGSRHIPSPRKHQAYIQRYGIEALPVKDG